MESYVGSCPYPCEFQPLVKVFMAKYPVDVYSQGSGFSSQCLRGFPVLAGIPSAGGDSQSWWGIPVLVGHPSAGGDSQCWRGFPVLVGHPSVGGASQCWLSLRRDLSSDCMAVFQVIKL